MKMYRKAGGYMDSQSGVLNGHAGEKGLAKAGKKH
jgi:hypothetical protein